MGDGVDSGLEVDEGLGGVFLVGPGDGEVFDGRCLAEAEVDDEVHLFSVVSADADELSGHGGVADGAGDDRAECVCVGSFFGIAFESEDEGVVFGGWLIEEDAEAGFAAFAFFRRVSVEGLADNDVESAVVVDVSEGELL